LSWKKDEGGKLGKEEKGARETQEEGFEVQLVKNRHVAIGKSKSKVMERTNIDNKCENRIPITNKGQEERLQYIASIACARGWGHVE